ncbi:MAG: cation:proton antiporter [Planctomycetota bacterium]|jgi:Kef-type K+ transport system membrane component KefB/mannitol/fructose-specific phosphotransferase system IIA component (Ntr-type)|nr:cation:proton antiporter [Planctomycetota bacterium]
METSELTREVSDVVNASAQSWDSGGGELIHRMLILVIQIAVIIFAVRIGGGIMKRLKLPSVLGELCMGIVIGPYVLGAVELPRIGFPQGIFPIQENGFPVSNELYGLSIIASIILLFMAGLETDLRQFLKYSIAGTFVGIGGVVVSFVAGDWVASVWGAEGGLDFFSPACLFLGSLCTATSVGITARILSDKKKMDSPEGVTILAAAIIDDVLGIICLAITISLVDILNAGSGNTLPWGDIGWVAFRTILVCLIFTLCGLVFASYISRFLKLFKNPTFFTTLALGLAFFSAAIFEMSGLAMIIGAYVAGLTLSKTDITHVVQERLHGLYEFFVPLFFAVMGMLVDVNRITKPEVLKVGLIYAFFAVVAKVVGCAFPAMFLRFNLVGAFRIGAGMVPRGEVALIIAGIGMSANILNPELFGAAIIMTLLTTMVAPPIFSLALGIRGKGVTRDKSTDDYQILQFPFSTPVVADAASGNVLSAFHTEGFFVSLLDAPSHLYSLRKDDIAFSVWREDDRLVFSTNRRDITFIHTVVYEALVDLHQDLDRLRDLAKPKEYRRTLRSVTSVRALPLRQRREILIPEAVIMRLNSQDKEEAIRELLQNLVWRRENEISDIDEIFSAIMDRESVAPTELEYGVALPHGRSDNVQHVMAAVGICPAGMNLKCLDGSPARLMILVVSPKNTSGPHLQFLASVTGSLRTQEKVDRIVSSNSPNEVVKLLIGGQDQSIVKRLFD